MVKSIQWQVIYQLHRDSPLFGGSIIRFYCFPHTRDFDDCSELLLLISYVGEYLVPSTCEADNRVAQSIAIPVCMYIRHTSIRMGSLVTRVQT